MREPISWTAPRDTTLSRTSPTPTVTPRQSGGFAPDSGARLTVEYAAGVQERVPEGKRDALTGVLANDPRPRYQHDSSRVYALEFAGLEVKFTVDGDVLTVISAEKEEASYVGDDKQPR